MEINENTKCDVKNDDLYLERITSIFNVPTAIGVVIFIVEWYIVYIIVYHMSGSWIWGTKEFEEILAKDPNMYKLRRYGNDFLINDEH